MVVTGVAYKRYIWVVRGKCCILILKMSWLRSWESVLIKLHGQAGIEKVFKKNPFFKWEGLWSKVVYCIPKTFASLAMETLRELSEMGILWQFTLSWTVCNFSCFAAKFLSLLRFRRINSWVWHIIFNFTGRRDFESGQVRVVHEKNIKTLLDEDLQKLTGKMRLYIKFCEAVSIYSCLHLLAGCLWFSMLGCLGKSFHFPFSCI